MGSDESMEAVRELWHRMGAKEWDKIGDLLDEAFEAYWPQSKEKIVGVENFIAVNREYPGEHSIKIMNMHHYEDRWDMVDFVISEVFIESKMPDGKTQSLFGISTFKVQDGIIQDATEYWADTCEPPAWRSQFVERY